jgi:protocatechuate 3,4-dioxygenase alpha subunit
MELTSSQTVGPFFHDCLFRDSWNELVDQETEGRIRIEGQVYDGDGEPVPDAMVEIWQADASGRYGEGDSSFIGFGRSATDAEGRYWFETIKPGRVDGAQSPHIDVQVFARGLLDQLPTRIYFDDEPGNNGDPVLGGLDEAQRSTLVARATTKEGRAVYVFDIVLQGDGETAFFDGAGGP